ncbi:unnamed protein product, partial [Lepidochelys olivacea]
RLSALPWTEMALVLVPAFCLLSGAYAQKWNVTFAPGPLAGWAGSCVTIPCSFTYPAGWMVRAVTWTRDRDQTDYHSDEDCFHAAFKGRARYLRNLQHDCSLRVSGLRPSDQGTYRFRFHAAGDGRTDSWTSDLVQHLSVSGNQVPSSTPRVNAGTHRHTYTPFLPCSEIQVVRAGSQDTWVLSPALGEGLGVVRAGGLLGCVVGPESLSLSNPTLALSRPQRAQDRGFLAGREGSTKGR